MAMINLFIKDCEKHDRSSYTIYGYRAEINKFQTWLHETTGESLERATDMDIKDYKQYLQVIKKQKPATINRGLKVLAMFYNLLVSQGLMQYNPAINIKLVQVQQAAPKWLDRNNANKLKRSVLHDEKNQFKRLRDYAILLLMFEAGLRVSEIAALEMSDIVLSDRKGTVIIRKGKGNKYGEIPMNKDLRQAMADYLGVRKAAKFANIGMLFIGERGAITKRAIQFRMTKYAKKANVEATAHQLRHTFCKELAKKEPLNVVAHLARHSNINTTRIYITPSERELTEAVEKISVSE